ncbi:MAG: branched-chain amino acid ABC transporter substrate-binding protein [Pseudomonadota bacterium]
MKYSKVLSVSVVTVLALTACGKSDSSAKGDSSVIKIGHAGPLTGTAAHLGKDTENGVRLAIEDANAKGIQIDGKKASFELVSSDDQGDPKIAPDAAKKLLDAKVAGVVGHLNSDATIVASKIYSDAGIPQISGSATTPKYTEQGFKTAFRVIANDAQQGQLIGSFIGYALQAKRFAIVNDGTSYGQRLAEEVEKAAKATGALLVAREVTSDKATEFKDILTKIQAAKPDVIFHGGLDATGGPMLKQMRDLGIKTQFIQGDGGCSPQFIKLAGTAAEGFICTQPGLPVDQMPAAQVNDFKDRFEKKFGPIQIFSPYAYDAASMLIAAMEKAKSSDPAKYLPELSKLRYDGITGKIEFDEKGDPKSGFLTIYKVQCAKLEVLFMQKSADVKHALEQWKENTPLLAPCAN